MALCPTPNLEDQGVCLASLALEELPSPWLWGSSPHGGISGISSTVGPSPGQGSSSALGR
jgi:hypothetical protein